MTMRIIIVDDEPRAHVVLENYISRIPGIELAGKFTEAEKAADFLAASAVEVILLDITMPQVDGFSFLRMLPRPPLIIFTTAHSEFAVESYEYNAIDYLKKPIPFERFVKAVNKAVNALPTGTDRVIPDNIQLKIDGEYRTFMFGNILYFQSLGNYVKVYTSSKMYVTQATTHEIEEALPREVFLRIHKSYIVNRAKIEKIGEEEVWVGTAGLPIGKTFKKYVKEAFHGTVPPEKKSV